MMESNRNQNGNFKNYSKRERQTSRGTEIIKTMVEERIKKILKEKMKIEESGKIESKNT